MVKLSMDELVNSRQMCHYLGMIMMNWDDDDGGYHDICNYKIGYDEVAWALAWASTGSADYVQDWFKPVFDFVFHDIKDNYEFDEDAVPHVEFWKEQLKEA